MNELIIILGLIFLNGLFCMIEIALVSARKSKLEVQANKGDTNAQKALELSSHPDAFLSTTQIGITLIGISTGLYSGEKIKVQLFVWLQQFNELKSYSNLISTTVVVIIITYLTMVLGELVPKRIGLSNPEKVSKLAARPIILMGRIIYPFIWLLTKSTGLLVRLLKINTAGNQVTEDEIKAIINEGTEQGTIDEAEQEIIERVFHLSDRNITSLMTHRTDIVWVDTTKTVGEMKQLFSKSINAIHSVYPVCEGQIDNIKGTVAIKDIIAAKDNNTLVLGLMKLPMYVPDNNNAYQLLEKFKETKKHHCFIVDEYGTIQGMITLNDILEAIVGDIPHQDDKSYEIFKRTEESYLIDAQIPFYDFLHYFEKTEWLDDKEYSFDTLAGFILQELEEIPSVGDKLDWRCFSFEIVDMDGNRIDKIQVTLKEESCEDDAV